MDFGIISTRYAKALLQFATEQGEADRVKAEMERILCAFHTTPAFFSAMLNPLLTTEQKANLLVSAACSETEPTPTKSLQRFAVLTTEHGRADLFSLICRRYITLYCEREGLIDVDITTAAPLTEENKEQLRTLVERHIAAHTPATRKHTLQIHEQEDANIGAGFVLEYGTYRLDASLRTRIARIKNSLING